MILKSMSRLHPKVLSVQNCYEWIDKIESIEDSELNAEGDTNNIVVCKIILSETSTFKYRGRHNRLPHTI